MKKILKKLVCLCLAMLLFTVCCYAVSASGDLVSNCTVKGKKVTVSGVGEDVSIFVLNPGKTVSDLNAVKSLTEFNETVNYTNVLNIGQNKEYSVTLTLNTEEEEATYLLYVKDKTSEYSAPINYVKEHILQVYVTYGASLDGDGTKAKPFATIELARDYIRTVEKNIPIEVIISGSVYKPKTVLEFTSQDSGTETAPITYKVADGEQFIFSGSKDINIAGTIKKVEDGNILGRVSSETARHLVEIDLSANGIPQKIADYLASHQVGYAGKTVGLYLNGERQTVSRWPNVGYSTMSNVDTTEKKLKIKNADDRLSAWVDAENLYIEGYFANDWYGQWTKVASVDSETQFITLADSPTHGLSNVKRRVAVVNLLEEIDIPGEWYIDAGKMKMYYYPPYELTSSDKLEIAVLDKNFINVIGAKYLNFEGFIFEKNADSPASPADSIGGGNGIFIRNASNVSVKNCTFRNIGMDAVYILTSSNLNIDSCQIYDIGLRGIFVKQSGNIDTLEGSNITISNNYMANVARDSGRNSCAGIYIDANCVGVTVENNNLCNMKNSAIRYAGNLHTINNNEIYNCVTDTGDAGAIYSGRSFTQYGTEIKNNYFHSIGAGLASEGAGAVFWDDKHSGNTFVGNIVDIGNVTNASGIRIGGGRDNTVEGNIFVNGDAVRGADRSVSFPEEYVEGDDSYYSNQEFQSFVKAANNVTNAYYITDADWKEAYKTKFSKIMENFDDLRNKKTYKRVNTFEGNILTGEIVLGEIMLADSTIKNNTTVNDMDVFVDAANGDYRLTEDFANTLMDVSEALPTESYTATIGIDTTFIPDNTETNFKLVYPFNRSVVNGGEVYLKWTTSNYANTYRYEVSEKADFSNPVAQGTTCDNCVKVTGLEDGKQYYWRVTAINKSKHLNYTVTGNEVYSFTVNLGVYFSDLSLDTTNNKLHFTAINPTGTTENVCLVAALKDASGKLVDLKSFENYSITISPQRDSIDVKFEKTGAYLELFILNSFEKLNPVTVKYTFSLLQ